LLTTIAYRLDGRATYALEGSIFVAGAAIQWLRDGLGIIRNAGDTAALAASVPDSGGVYFVPALTGLGAPHWDPDARGLISGLDRQVTAAHLVRAALESVSFQTRDLIEAMRRDGIPAVATLRVDGGMVANDWLLQNLADLIGAPVERAAIAETTALGAALLAGLQIGVFGSLHDVARRWHSGGAFHPGLDAGRRDALYAGWHEAVRRSFSKTGAA
jgi:glycerol kinase